MKNVFPSEIINCSVETHFFKFNKKSIAIYLITILLLVAIIVSLPFLKIEITFQNKGIFRSLSEPIQLTSPVVAEVIKTSILENKLVQIGDTLIWLNTEKTQEKINYLKALILQNEMYLNDISNILLYKYEFLRTDLYKSTHSHYRQKLSDFEFKINLLQKEFNRTLNLYSKEVIPLAEKEQKEFELNQIIEEKKLFIRQKRNEWQGLISEYSLQNSNYENEIAQLKRDIENYHILAPVTGYITNYSGVQPGSFIITGQTIAAISPNDSIITECLISPKDIGYLRIGMSVFYQIDAYNYHQWGFASGEIFDISNEIYIVNNQPFFKVKCTLNESYLTLTNGFKGEFKKGLTVTARFKITERTLAQLLFDKAENWLNPKIINE